MGAAGVTRRGGAHNSSSAAVVEDKKEPSEARTTKRAKGSSSSMKQVLVRRLTRRGAPRVGTGSKMGVRAHMSQARGTRCFMLLGAPASNSPLTESLAGYQTASTVRQYRVFGTLAAWPSGPRPPAVVRARIWLAAGRRSRVGCPLGANGERDACVCRAQGTWGALSGAPPTDARVIRSYIAAPKKQCARARGSCVRSRDAVCARVLAPTICQGCGRVRGRGLAHRGEQAWERTRRPRVLCRGREDHGHLLGHRLL